VRVLGVWPEMAVTGTREQRIAAVAARQRGRIARRQLGALGVPSSTITWLTGHHRLLPLLRAVFAVGHATPVHLGEETAALLAAGDDAALGGLSAAALWKLVPSRGGPVHITLCSRHGPELPNVEIHRTRSLKASDRCVRDGLPVLSPARALLDVSELLSPRRFEQAIVQGIATPAQIRELLTRTGGRRGGPLLAAQLQRQTSGPTLTRSEAEERLLDLIRRAELPAPRINSRLHGYEVDFYWAAAGLVVEVDGYQFHRSRWAFERDRRKDATLQRAGITVIRVTWSQIVDEPLAVVALIAGALARGT
jgi:very-short-patch-repair endonuclease